MRGYIIVLRALMRMTFRKGAGGRDRSLGTLIGMLITAGIMSACVAVVAGIFGGKINEFGLVTEVTALLLAADFMLTLIFGIVSVMSSLYFSRDGEFLASLPVRSNAVMAAKVSVIYVQEAAVGGLFVLPAAITLGVAASATAAFYVMTVIAVVFVPVAALLLAALVSVPLVYVAGFFRRRGAVAAVLLLVLFALLMTAYLVVTNLVPAVSVPSDGGDAVGAAISALIGGVRRGMYVIYPVYCLARFGCGGDGLLSDPAASAAVDLCIFIGAVALLAAVLFPVSALLYRRTVLRQTENAPASRRVRKDYTMSGVLGAFVRKEFRMLMRNPSFAFQCLGGVVLSPVMCVLIFVMGGVRSGEDPAASVLVAQIMWSVAVMIMLMMLGGMNFTALTAITREGSTFCYSKTIPVPFRTQLTAKRIISLVPAYASAVLSVVCSSVACGAVFGVVDPLCVISALMLMAAALPAFAEAFLLRDLSHPRLDWVTARDAIKGNPATVVPTLLGIFVSIAVGIAVLFSGLGLFMLGWEMRGTAAVTAAFAAAFAAVYVAVRARLASRADKLYERLSV